MVSKTGHVSRSLRAGAYGAVVLAMTAASTVAQPEMAQPHTSFMAQADFSAQSKNGVFPLTDLVVEVIQEGDGPVSQVGQTLVVEFTSWIMQGGQPSKVFDSTTARGGPWSFVLGRNQAVKGWDSGLQGMKVGATRRLTMPPEMAYGERGFAGPTAFVPPGAWVMSEITLLSIE